MATRRAIANGNWSATGTWNGGVVPTNGDTVYANGFNVTLDVDVNIGGANNPTVNTGSLVSGQWYEIVNVGGQTWTTLGAASNTVGTVFQSTGTGTSGNLGTALALATLSTATNTAAGATTGGGVFVMSTIRAMTADLRAGTTACLNVTATSGTLVLDSLRILAGSATGAHGCNYAGAATCTLANSTFTGTLSGTSALNNSATGTINVSGPCTFTGGSTGSGFALNNSATGIINVSGSCTFTGGSGATTFALNNAATGTINVSGSCTFTAGSGSGAAIAFNNAATGTINVSGSCTFTGGGANAGLQNASTGTVIIENATFTASAFATAVAIANTSADVRLSGDFLDHWSGWKAVNGAKWRLGTAPTLGQTRYALAGTTDSYFTMYGADNGSFGNPIAANVRSGISYGSGNLTGTCEVPAASSVAFGVPVDATTGTATLTAANVRTALGMASANMDTQLSVLSNLDAAVSSRLAPSGTLATVTTLTNAPASVTPAQIRQELDSNSTKLANLDTTVSSRLASSVSTNITAIKAKTDLLNTDRLAQCATTSIVGNLIAQSNS